MFLSKYIKEVGPATDYPKFENKDFVKLELPVTDLYLVQYLNDDFNAVDIAVKYLAIENYYGENLFGFKLYQKLQEKRTGKNWNERYYELIKSFEKGFWPESSMELDLNYSIHDGAHRLALALYHNISLIPTTIYNVELPRRIYNQSWLMNNGFTPEELFIISTKQKELLDKCRKPYYCLFWPPARKQYIEMIEELKQIEKGIHIEKVSTLRLTKNEFRNFIYSVYETDDIQKYKLDLKYSCIINSLTADNYCDETYDIYVVKLIVDNSDFRFKPLTGMPQSRTTMRLKRNIRDRFKSQVTEYYYDIIMHLTDNQIQNEAVEKIIDMYS